MKPARRRAVGEATPHIDRLGGQSERPRVLARVGGPGPHDLDEFHQVDIVGTLPPGLLQPALVHH